MKNIDISLKFRRNGRDPIRGKDGKDGGSRTFKGLFFLEKSLFIKIARNKTEKNTTNCSPEIMLTLRQLINIHSDKSTMKISYQFISEVNLKLIVKTAFYFYLNEAFAIMLIHSSDQSL